MISGDDITVALRVVLAMAAFGASAAVVGLYRRSRDHNPIPWVFFASVLALYGLALVAFILGSRLTIADWWRPFFSMLNLSLITGSMWTPRRAVRHG